MRSSAQSTAICLAPNPSKPPTETTAAFTDPSFMSMMTPSMERMFSSRIHVTLAPMIPSPRNSPGSIEGISASRAKAAAAAA